MSFGMHVFLEHVELFGSCIFLLALFFLQSVAVLPNPRNQSFRAAHVTFTNSMSRRRLFTASCNQAFTQNAFSCENCNLSRLRGRTNANQVMGLSSIIAQKTAVSSCRLQVTKADVMCSLEAGVKETSVRKESKKVGVFVSCLKAGSGACN